MLGIGLGGIFRVDLEEELADEVVGGAVGECGVVGEEEEDVSSLAVRQQGVGASAEEEEAATTGVVLGLQGDGQGRCAAAGAAVDVCWGVKPETFDL